MKRFLQLHLLTSYPPSNLNRDDLGRPKTAVMGGRNRLRISSQSLKRAWRASDLFESSLEGHVGTRTKDFGITIYKKLLEKGISDKKAYSFAREIADIFGEMEPEKKNDKEIDLSGLKLKQLAHISPEEKRAVDDLIGQIVDSGELPDLKQLDILQKKHSAGDIAMFGRMLASEKEYNTEAAVQVAHAITVHEVAVENDFFTAVDDLNLSRDDAGAAHMGETEYGAGIFYLYVCIDRALLSENLKNDNELANKAIAALIEAAAKVSPTGKQNSFASRAYASYILAEKGDQQPRSLAVAFTDPVKKGNLLEQSIEALNETRRKIDTVYGECADETASMNALTGEGTLADVITFAGA